MTGPRKSPHDWIVAAFRALANGGPQAVRVERIAVAMGVSKGSFYWHFRNADDLRDAMLAHWVVAATEMPIAAAEDATPPDRLARLIGVIGADLAAPYGGATAESGLRAWARTDPVVANALAAVDSRRLTWLTALFQAARAKQPDFAARLFYGAQIGGEILGHPDRNADLAALAAVLLRTYSSVAGSETAGSDRSP